jgi:hypothetical protein
MLPERLFRRIDRARLEAGRLAAARPELRARLHELVRAREAYAGDGAVGPLQRACQHLVDTLDHVFGLPAKRVVLRDRPRPHRRRNGKVVYELHGQCDPQGPLEVYTRTAVRAAPVAVRTLLETLLHEWVHHHDFVRFGASVHCRGFYERLGQVHRPAREILGPPGGRAGSRP